MKKSFITLLALALFALATWSAQASAATVWMSPTVNDGSFESWTSVLTDTWNNSEAKNARASGVWSYGVTDNAGNPQGVSAGNLGALRPPSNSPNIKSDGSIGFFVDPSDRKITLTSDSIAIPVGVAAGDTLSWSYDVGALDEYDAADSFLSLGIDFGNGVVNFSNDPTLNGASPVMETYSGNHVLTSQDLSAGTFSVEVVMHNIEGTKSGRLFVDNVNLSSVPIPEPASLALFGLGGLMMMIRRRKKL